MVSVIRRCTSGQQCMLLPNKTVTEIQSVYIEDDEYKYANPGNSLYYNIR